MLKTSNLNKTYRQGTNIVHAVENVNLEIGKGERVYIHGPSGAGKSTLLHMLGSLDSPTKGEVMFKDKSIYAMSDRKRSKVRNRFFGFVFQFYHLLPELSVLKNVMLPAMIKGGQSSKKIKIKAMELLEAVDMGGRIKHRPSQISGGEAQRTAVARALINSPEILFCDEPTGNLDSEMGAQIYSLIRDISDDKDMSVVVVSHQDVEKNFFHSEYIMKDGTLEKISSSQSIKV